MSDINDVVIALIEKGAISDWKAARVAYLGLRLIEDDYRATNKAEDREALLRRYVEEMNAKT